MHMKFYLFIFIQPGNTVFEDILNTDTNHSENSWHAVDQKMMKTYAYWLNHQCEIVTYWPMSQLCAKKIVTKEAATQ